MFDYNFIKIGYTLIIAPILIFGLLLNLFEKYLPTAVIQTIRYGKFAYKGEKDQLITKLEVPKEYFKHFYVFSTAYSSLVLIVMINIYIFGASVPLGFVQLLDFTVGVSRQSSVTAFSSLLALFLLTVQCYRRLYETYTIQVFASHSKINVFHYMVGFAHYAGAIGAIIGEAPEFAQTNHKSYLDLNDIRLLDVVGLIVFLWGWSHQYISNIILANLRKDHRGAVITHEHKIPSGDLFELVSNPHLLTEIVMYAGLTLILLGNTTWYYVMVWIIANQVEVALLNHWWYKQTFKDYPKERKAIIPYIY